MTDPNDPNCGSFEFIFNFAPTIIMTLTQDAKIIQCNTKIYDFLGYPVENIINQSLFFLFAKENHKTIKNILNRAFSSNSSYNFQSKMMKFHSNNEFIEVNISCSVNLNPQNIPVAILIIEDISEQKEIESHLINKTSGLEKELDYKIKVMLQQERLAVLGKLTASIAHDINNPLQFIRGNAEFLLKNNFESISNLKTYLERIIKGCDRIGETTKRLKRISRVDSSVQEFNVIDTIHSAISMTHSKWKLVCSEIQNNLNAVPLMLIKGYENDISHVFMNLIVNAAQSINKNTKGEIIISVLLDDKKKSVEIKIKDNGNGIPPDILQKIGKEPITTKSFEEGTGLGLLGVYDIVENHQGKVEVNSNLGQGTEFTIHLPLAEVKESA